MEQVQFWLSSLAQFDSDLPSVRVDGSFGAATERAVKAFQKSEGLTQDGVVGQTTWQELYAEWVNAQSDAGGTAYPGTALRTGSRGNAVRLVQFWLRLAAENYTGLSNVTVDGRFGSGTASAVRAFQRLFGLTADGVVGAGTWAKLNEVGLAVANNLVGQNIQPGQFVTTLREGSTGTRCGRCNITCACWPPIIGCAHSDGGRNVRRSHPQGGHCLAGTRGPDGGWRGGAADLAEHL